MLSVYETGDSATSDSRPRRPSLLSLVGEQQMGWYVHLHGCFSAGRNEGVAAIARRHLALPTDDCPEARWFLDDLARRTGENPGPKGGLSLWGIIGNHTNAENFVESLRPFWIDLLSDQIEVEGGPHSFEHVIVFYEEEQSEAANAFEIGWDDENSEERRLVVRHHRKLPFSWRQY
jgi:hypothetical protein